MSRSSVADGCESLRWRDLYLSLQSTSQQACQQSEILFFFFFLSLFIFLNVQIFGMVDLLGAAGVERDWLLARASWAQGCILSRMTSLSPNTGLEWWWASAGVRRCDNWFSPE